MSNDYDVIVAGGGPSGIGAAFAAARSGRKVAILERNAFLGGVATNSSLPLLLNRKAHDTLDLSGEVYKSIISRIRSENNSYYGAIACDFVDLEQYKMVLDKMAAELRIDVFFHAWGFEAIKSNQRKISGIRVLTRQGAMEFHAPLIVDATGDASIAAVADCETELIQNPQPMTMMLRIGNVNVQKGIDAEVFSSADGKNAITWSIRKYFDAAKAESSFNIPRSDISLCCTNPASTTEVLVNGTRILHKHNLNAREISEAEQEGRRQAFELLKLFKKYVPGFENSYLIGSGPEIGVREGRRLVGKYRLTRDDVTGMASFEDAIAACAYAIDVHNPDDGSTELIELHNVGRGFYQIPFRCCQPRDFGGLLVVGRAISADTAAAGSFRVMPTVMSIGEGAIDFYLQNKEKVY
jgi:hypothetical protein